MIKAVVFDLDGTLLDRDTSLQAFLIEQYHSIPALQKIEFSLYLDRFTELDQRGYVWKDMVYQQLINEYQFNITKEELLDDYLERFQYHCVGFNGVNELLSQLKKRKLKLGIITNGFSKFQRANISGLGITDYFDVIVVSEEEKIKKPAKEIFDRALQRLQVSANEAIYVGDHPKYDVEGSKEAGMIAIWKEDPHYEKPELICHSIIELIELIEILEYLRARE